MGAQIGIEYQSGGHDVVFLARDVRLLEERLAAGVALARQIGIDPSAGVGHIAAHTDIVEDIEIIVESLPEDVDLKVKKLLPLAAAYPQALIVSNTSSLSITALGEAIRAPERTLGVHYWNPPLLMPLVEVIPGSETASDSTLRITSLLSELGKLPIVVRRDVPGFIWNRLQLAVMREALWLADNGVAAPTEIDTVVREGLARRWRHVGPFAAAALGGASTWVTIGENLLRELSQREDLATLPSWLIDDPVALSELRDRRDASLLAEVRSDRAPRGTRHDAT